MFSRAFSRRLVYQHMGRSAAAAIPKPSNLQALKAKEAGPWSAISLEEKRALYKSTYGLSRVERLRANKIDGKKVFAGTMVVIALGVGLFGLAKLVFGRPYPHTLTP
eukprot:Sdes_comp15239_c0_seq1m4074